MIIDIRYHIASLVAVFLALGIGILIGSALLGNDTIAKQQQQIIGKLENDFEQIRTENKQLAATVSDLQDNIKYSNDFQKYVLPIAVNSRLLGKKVAIIKTGTFEDAKFIDQFASALEQAGAEVRSTTILADNPLELIKDNLGEFKKVLGVNEDMDEQDFSEMLFQRVAQEIALGGVTPVLNSLKDASIIKPTGSYESAVNTIIFVGGSSINDNDAVKQIDLNMINTFKLMKKIVVGTEPTTVVNSYIRYYRKKDIPTIDNVDTVPGQIACILAIEGRTGNFGVKPTAKHLLPIITK